MIPKKYRLNRKDVIYINKQKTKFFTKFFSFSYIFQYSNRKYNQISLHIPASLSKRATVRHFIKRKLISYVIVNFDFLQKIGSNYYKIFINLNKKNLNWLKEKFWFMSKEEFRFLLYEQFSKDFESFLKYISMNTSKQIFYKNL